MSLLLPLRSRSANSTARRTRCLWWLLLGLFAVLEIRALPADEGWEDPLTSSADPLTPEEAANASDYAADLRKRIPSVAGEVAVVPAQYARVPLHITTMDWGESEPNLNTRVHVNLEPVDEPGNSSDWYDFRPTPINRNLGPDYYDGTGDVDFGMSDTVQVQVGEMYLLHGGFTLSDFFCRTWFYRYDRRAPEQRCGPLLSAGRREWWDDRSTYPSSRPGAFRTPVRGSPTGCSPGNIFVGGFNG